MSAEEDFVNACVRGDVDTMLSCLRWFPERMATIKHPLYDEYSKAVKMLLVTVFRVSEEKSPYGVIPAFGNLELVEQFSENMSEINKMLMYEFMAYEGNLHALRLLQIKYKFPPPMTRRWLFLAAKKRKSTTEMLAFLLGLLVEPYTSLVGNMCTVASITHMEMVIARNLELGGTIEEMGRHITYTNVHYMPVPVFVFLRERLGAFPDTEEVLRNAPRCSNGALWELLGASDRPNTTPWATNAGRATASTESDSE